MCKKIFLDNLPHKGKLIDWQNSVGYKVKGIYDYIEFEVKIVDYDVKNRFLFIKYKNKKPLRIRTDKFTQCRLNELMEEEIHICVYNENKPRRVDLRKLPLNGYGINWSKIAKNKIKIPFVYEDVKGEVEIINYNSKTRYLYIKYLDKPIFKIYTNNFQKCQLGELLGKRTSEFKIELGQTFKDDKRDITIIDRKYEKSKNGWNRKYYKYKCNKCGFDGGEHYKKGEYYKEHWIEESDLLHGNGCACCCSTSQIVVQGINDIATTVPEIIKYFQNSKEAKMYSKGSKHKIYPICPDCGRIKSTMMEISTICKYKSIGCSCGDGISYPEKFMHQLLEQLTIKFIYQYKPKWCKYELNNKIKTGRYDFYFELNEQQYIVEMDGGFHNIDNRMNGQTKEESKLIDNYKDRLANKNNILMIRIDCKESDLEYIKDKILHSKLNDLVDLSKINWLKCEEFALSNLVKKACEYKRDNPDLTTVQIGKIMNMCKVSIRKYLKKGNLLGWCEYASEIEFENKKINSKSVEIFKNDKSLGIFQSCSELSKKSERLFNTKIDSRRISDVCNNKIKQYKGFTFKYI